MKDPAWRFTDCPDYRQLSKVTHPIQHIIRALLLGLICNRKTLRDSELLTKILGPMVSSLVPNPISDTTLYTAIGNLSESYFLGKLVQQILSMHRKKQLRSEVGSLGTATIDGKNLATLTLNPNGQGHPRELAEDKWKKYAPSRASDEGDYYLFPALRATLSSNEAAPVLYHQAIPPGGSESGSFHGFLDALHQAYGHLELFRVIDVDAGFTSLQNAQLITSYGYYFLMGLKDNQPTLLQKAKNHFICQWVNKKPALKVTHEVRNGATVRRSLWVSNRLEGAITSAGEWSDVTEVWCVRQETEEKNGTVKCEDRFFLSSIPVEMLNGSQRLRMIRQHWVVENDVFNSLDVQWKEDSAVWSTQGKAIGTLGVLRLIAYNIVQFLRKRHLCRKKPDGTRVAPLPWRALFEVITDVFKGLNVGQREAPQVSITI